MINLKGIPTHINQFIVGKVVKRDYSTTRKKQNILITDKQDELVAGYGAIIFRGDPITSKMNIPVLYLDAENQQDITFQENDIIVIYPNGDTVLLYRSSWKDLTIFFTNKCNSRCVMCPQIADVEDEGDFLTLNKQLLNLLPEDVEHIAITGGEPTIFKNELVELINYINDLYPEIAISLLTNGRSFSDESFVKIIKKIGHRKIIFCIPLYAANCEQHDKIVGIKGAFQETIKGLYNLYMSDFLIEIRIVVFNYNYKSLEDFSEFLYRNLPFVRHIAFMGMEYIGNAAKDIDDFWIEPLYYKKQLHKAVWFLHQRNMNVSIYNVPLCLLDIKSRMFARDSISTWKKLYLPACNNCVMKKLCSGIFATSVRQSNFISSITKC